MTANTGPEVEIAPATRLRVLMCAAACHPDMGSEFGVGWQWATQAAKRHHVTLITADAHGSREATEHRLRGDPRLAAALECVYVPWFDPPQSRLLERAWVFFPPLYYYYYRRWLRRAADCAARLLAERQFDLVHQVTYISFREPGYLWTLGKPFVWGPVGGTQQVPARFLPCMGFAGALRFGIRNLINWCEFNLRTDVAGAFRSAAGISAVASDTRECIRRRYERESVVIPATTCHLDDIPPRRSRSSGDPVTFVFCGFHNVGKGLPMVLKSLAAMTDVPWRLNVIGSGPETGHWQAVVARLGLSDRVSFVGRLTRSAAVAATSQSDVFVFPSFKEGWPTVIMEALGLGLPVVTFRQHGMADMIDDTCGFCIPMTNPRRVVREMTTALHRLATDDDLLATLSAGAIVRSSLYTAARQESAISQLYETALQRGASR